MSAEICIDFYFLGVTNCMTLYDYYTTRHKVAFMKINVNFFHRMCQSLLRSKYGLDLCFERLFL